MPTIRVRPRHPRTGSPMVGEPVTVRYTQILFGADDSTIGRSSYLNTNAQGFADFLLDSSAATNPANAQVRFSWNGVSGLLATVPATEGPNVDGTVHYWELEQVIDAGQLAPVAVVAGVQSVTGTSVNNTDPRNPVITGGGGAASLTPTAVKTANYTAAVSDLVPVDTTSGSVTVTLPTAPADKAQVGVKHVIRGGTNTVTLAAGGSDVFNKAGGSTALTLTLLNQAAVVQYEAAGAIWYVVSDDLSLAQLDLRFDATGAASTAQTAAATYTDGKITAEVTRANAAYDALGAAAAAQAAAIAASQPLDSDLTAIAALATTSFGRALLTQADAAATRTTLGLGTAATQASTAFDASGAAAAAQAASQPLDSDLTAIAALATTTFGRSFLALADAAAARTLLGLGTLATQSGTFSGTSSGTNTGDQTLPTTLPPNGAAGGDLAGTYPNPTLKNTGTAGTYGDATHSLTVTTDAQGRVTAVTTNAISSGAPALTKQAKTANYTAALGEMVLCDTTGGTFTVTLPAASGGRGRLVVKWTAGSAPPSIALTGSDHINTSTGSTGGAFTLLNQAAQYESDGAALWVVTAEDLPLSTLDARMSVGGLRRAGGYYQLATASGSATTASNNTEYCLPVIISNACTVDRIACEVTTAGNAGSVIRLGLRADNGRGLPGATVVLDAGTVAADTTGTKEITVSQALSPGMYWATLTAQSAATTAPVVRRGNDINYAAQGVVGWTTSIAATNQPVSGYGQAGVSGALPSSFTLALVTGAAGLPNIWMRFV